MKPNNRTYCAAMASLASLLTAPLIQAAPLTWDPGATGASDGAGTWLDAGKWWDGAAAATWNNATPDDATIGNGGAGGKIIHGLHYTPEGYKTLGQRFAEKSIALILSHQK
jgi:hypothetical protein